MKTDYRRWRGRRWSSLAHQHMCWTHKCSSPRPGWQRAEWWADCQTTRRSARLCPGMGALSWGHFAWQKRPLLWSLPAGGRVSKRSAPPFQEAHRNTRGRLSFPSRRSCCGPLWLVLEAERGHNIGKNNNRLWKRRTWIQKENKPGWLIFSNMRELRKNKPLKAVTALRGYKNKLCFSHRSADFLN